jgi:hypothetical protein
MGSFHARPVRNPVVILKDRKDLRKTPGVGKADKSPKARARFDPSKGAWTGGFVSSDSVRRAPETLAKNRSCFFVLGDYLCLQECGAACRLVKAGSNLKIGGPHLLRDAGEVSGELQGLLGSQIRHA